MTQEALPFLQQDEEQELCNLLLKAARRDLARMGLVARLLSVYGEDGTGPGYVALVIVQPADEPGVKAHRSIKRAASKVLQQARYTTPRNYRERIVRFE